MNNTQPSIERQIAAVEIAAKPSNVRDGLKCAGMREPVIEMQIGDLNAALVTLNWIRDHRDLLLAVRKLLEQSQDKFSSVDELVAYISSYLKRGAQ